MKHTLKIGNVEIFLISCIKKNPRDNRHEAIKAIGNGIEQMATEEAIRMIEDKTGFFYTINLQTDGKPELTEIAVVDWQGRKYLRSIKNGTHCDNLLNLKECT